MQDIRLNQAVEIYFTEGADRSRKGYQEAEKYLKLRIRPAMELLIQREETDKMELLEKQGWFGEKELDLFIDKAQESKKIRSLVGLLHLKNDKYGFHEKKFPL